MKCWICGLEATTKEHKIKKSTLKNVYQEEFQNGNMLHFKNGKYSKIQGIDSNKIKYQKSLCAKCNGEFTHPFDKSYEIFLNYIIKNNQQVSNLRIINFFDIFKEDFPIMQTNLFKYFMKIFGCDLIEYGHYVPQDLITLLNHEHFETRIKITFSINETFLTTSAPTKVLYGNGPLVTTMQNLKFKNELDTKYRFEINLSYLRVNFFYNCCTDIGLGSDWIADKQYLYIGSSKEMSEMLI
ncbi:MAG: hypothetical protein ACI81I_001139 [Arcobacteraceae bacterium]